MCGDFSKSFRRHACPVFRAESSSWSGNTDAQEKARGRPWIGRKPIYTAILWRINRRPPIRLDRRNLHAAAGTRGGWLRRARVKLRVFHTVHSYTHSCTNVCGARGAFEVQSSTSEKSFFFPFEFTAFRENNCLSGINLLAGVYGRSSSRRVGRRCSALRHRARETLLNSLPWRYRRRRNPLFR